MINSQVDLEISEPILQQKQTTTDLLASLKSALQKVTCVGNNKAIFFCSHRNCQKSPPICGIQSCQCKSDHLDCFQNFQSTLFQRSIDQKINQQAKLKNQIQAIFEKLIDQIYNFKSSVISSLKDLFIREEQKNFIKIVVNSQVKNIQSKYLAKLMPYISSKLNQQNQLLKNQLINKCLKLQQQNRMKIQNLLNQIKYISQTHDIKPFDDNFSEIQDKSLIISHKHEIFTLKSFMPEGNFDKLKLLYRASRHDFRIKFFYQNCNVQNTLILIKTQKDKIIGGFTPIPWNSKKQSIQNVDHSGQTFTFSLTNKDKFIIIDNNKATYVHENGPRFGQLKSPDLGIGDKGNRQMDGNVIFYGMNFTNSKYTNCEQTYVSFTGFDTNQYLIKEWQVYQVIF